MTNPITLQARENVAKSQTPANGRAIMRGEWDAGTLVQDEIKRILRERPEAESE